MTITFQKTEPPVEVDFREHILLVEDDDGTRVTLNALLQEEGFIVTEARNGAEALRLLLAGNKPSFLVTDLEMPEMDGSELIREVVDRGVEIKGVVLFSAASPEDERIHGVRSYVRKRLPFSFVCKGEGDILASLMDGIRMLI